MAEDHRLSFAPILVDLRAISRCDRRSGDCLFLIGHKNSFFLQTYRVALTDNPEVAFTFAAASSISAATAFGCET